MTTKEPQICKLSLGKWKVNSTNVFHTFGTEAINFLGRISLMNMNMSQKLEKERISKDMRTSNNNKEHVQYLFSQFSAVHPTTT